MLIVEHLKLVKKTSQKRELGPRIFFFLLLQIGFNCV